MDNYTKLSIDKLQENIENLKKISDINANLKIEEENISKIDSELIEIKNDRDRINDKIFKLNNYKKNHKKLVETLLLIHACAFVGGLIFVNLVEVTVSAGLLPLKENLFFSLLLQLVFLAATIPSYFCLKKNFKDNTYTKEELEDMIKTIDEDIKSLKIKKEQKLANIESLKEEIQNLLNQEQTNIEEVSNILNARDNAINQKIMDIDTFDNKLNSNFDTMKLKLKK